LQTTVSPVPKCTLLVRASHTLRHRRTTVRTSACFTFHAADTVLWACFHFPTLPLNAVFGTQATAAQPCALYEGPRQRPLVAYANEAAQMRGVRPGLVLATARALCAELDARKREPDAERQALHLLATWAYRFSGQVSRSEPDTLWLEVGASLTLFKGWPTLQQQLHTELQALGFGAYRLGVAPVAAAARVLALSYEQIALRQHSAMLTALNQASLALCGLPAQTIAQLQGMGFRCLRDIFSLPRVELARRIGPDGVRHLDTLRGQIAETLTLYQPPDRFSRRIELDALVDSWQPLLFPLRRLVHELALYLHVRDSGVQRFELRLEHESHAATRIPIGLVSVQRDAPALYEFSRGRLERAEIGAEVSAIALVADDLPPFRPGHRDLFEPARSEGLDWPALTERLRSRLGDEALQGLACVADHRPERAWRFTPLAAAARENERKPRATKAIAVDLAALPSQQPAAARPLWLLAQPIPLRQPLAQILAGPERIESGWWDGADARRDYYVVRCANGQRAWAFLPAGENSGWMLHGWFA
jgi:protein ImuB